LILFGFLPQSSKTKAVAVAISVPQLEAAGQDADTTRSGDLTRGDLVRFREVFYGCLTARADELFELTEALLCVEGPVRSLVDLSLTAAATGREVDRAWQAFLRRFDLEHTFILRGFPTLLQDVA
jgi:hypothetical protein